MTLSDLSWPVYKLGTERPMQEEGVLFYIYKEKMFIVDDTTIESDSLAGRRLKLLVQKVNLFKLKHAFFFLGDFIKVAKTGIWFIDATGKIFTYTKKQFTPLICRKITKIIPSVSCALIEVQGIQSRFKVLFQPQIEEKYAGLLRLGKGYIFYGFYAEPFDDTVRKI